jgi:hypothetical protein
MRIPICNSNFRWVIMPKLREYETTAQINDWVLSGSKLVGIYAYSISLKGDWIEPYVTVITVYYIFLFLMSVIFTSD